MTDTLTSIAPVSPTVIKRVIKTISPLTAGTSVNQWAIGDALCAEFPVSKHGPNSENLGVNQALKEIAKATDVGHHTLRAYRHIAAIYPPSQRVKGRSYTSHRYVAPLSNRVELLKDKVLSADDLKFIARGDTETPKLPRINNEVAFQAYDVLQDNRLTFRKRVEMTLEILGKFVLPACEAAA